MKKLIALALALVMALSMGSVAFASMDVIDDAEDYYWGNISLDQAHIEVDMGYGEILNDDTNNVETYLIAPGSKAYVDLVGLLEDGIDVVGISEKGLKNFKSDYEVTMGAALIKNIEYKNGKLVFEMMENYTIDEVKYLEFTVTLTAKRDMTDVELGLATANMRASSYMIPKGWTLKLVVTQNGIFSYMDDTVPVEDDSSSSSSTGADAASYKTTRDITANESILFNGNLGVCNAVVMLQGAEDADDADVRDITGWTRNNIIYKVEEDEAGYVKFGSSNSLFQITAKMNSEEKLFLHLIEDDQDTIDALAKTNKDAELHTYTMEGRVSFRTPAEFTLQADYADQYTIYAYNNGQLTKLDTEWDNDEGVYKWTATEMTTYVLSDVELVAAAETDKANPETGADSLLGVGAALAAMTLAAAVVVRKKK